MMNIRYKPKVPTIPDTLPNSTHSDSGTVIVSSSIGGKSSIVNSPLALTGPGAVPASHESRNS